MFNIPAITLQEGLVHIVASYIPEQYRHLESLWDILSDTEKIKALKFTTQGLKDNYVISHGLLRHILSAYSSILPQDIKYSMNEFGKPFLKNHSKIQFNISHSKDYAAYVISSNHQVGIDIEWKNRSINIHEIADFIFSVKEIEVLNTLNTAEKNNIFYEVWTKKEAIVKAIGHGLSYPIKEIDVLSLCNDTIIKHSYHHNISYYPVFQNLQNYTGAIASTRKIENIICDNI